MKLFKSFLIVITLLTSLAVKAQLTVNAVVKHAVPTSTANVGDIFLTVNGGTPPYTYSWVPSGTGANLTSAVRNNYTVSVFDAMAASVNYQYGLGYRTKLRPLRNLTSRNDSVFGYGDAISINTLKRSVNGWSEQVVKTTAGSYMIGFCDSLSTFESDANDVDFGYALYSGSVWAYVNGYYSANLVAANIGDVIRVERVNTDFNLLVNGTIIYSIPADSTKNLKLKVLNFADTLTNIGCSFLDSTNINFSNYVRNIPSVIHCTPGQSNGVISLAPNLPGITQSYTVNPGSSTLAVTPSLSVGTYTVKTKDINSNQSDLLLNVGYKTKWANLNGVVFRNDSLYGVGPNYGCISKNTLQANTDGWAETILNSGTPFFLSFCDSSMLMPNNTNDLDRGFYYNGVYLYYIIDGGYGYIQNPLLGDVVRIERIDTMFNLKLNGVTIYSSTMSKTRDVKLKAHINGGFICNVGASFIDTTNSNFPNFVRNYGIIRHCTPGQSNGAITLMPYVPGEVHTYTLSPGGYTTTTTSSLSAGTVTVETEDQNSNTSSQLFNIGYKTYWTHLQDVMFRNDSLMIMSGFENGVVSKNTLKSNVTGWSEFVLESHNAFYLGFTDSLSLLPSTVNDIDYGFYYNSPYLYYLSEGGYGFVNYTNIGDIIRIERSDSTFNLLQNGYILFSANMPRDKDYKLKAFLNSTSVANIGASFIDSTGIDFPNYVRDIPLIRHSSAYGINNGDIKLSPKYGELGNRYNWLVSGDNTNYTDSLLKNKYRVTITDTLLNTSSYDYEVLYKTKWTNLDSCIVRNDTLMNIYGYGGYFSAASQNVLNANRNGEISWTADNVSSYRFTGFADTLSTVTGDYLDIDEGTYEYAGFLYYLINGGYYFLGYYNIGDIFVLRRTSDTVSLYQNNILVSQRSVLNSGVDWKVKVSLHPGNLIYNVGCSFNNSINATIVRKHAEYSSPFTGSITVTPNGGVPPYEVSWDNNDGIISNSRDSVAQGSYSVNIRDSQGNDFIGKVINIGQKPHWNLKKNINFTSDSVWTSRLDSLGLAVSDTVIARNRITWHEGVVKNMVHDFSIGFISDTSTIFGSPLLLTRVDTAYALMRNAVDGSLSFGGTPDSVLSTGPASSFIHLIRIKNGKIRPMINGSSYKSIASYTVGDALKIGRDENNRIYIAVNDIVVFKNSGDYGDQLLYPVMLAEADSPVMQKAIYTGGPPANQIPLSSNQYAVLHRELDGSYYNARSNKLYFTIDGEYNTVGLDYKVYNYQRSLMTGLAISTPNLINGDNRYYINVTSLSFGVFYVLEVINQKKEKRVLRFMKPWCPACP